MKIIGQIFQEENYDVFRRLSDNRDVTQGRINKLVASISEKYILNPIVVNERMEIIDGQGRFDALKSLGLPIDYTISYGASSEDCRRMNKYNTKWSTMDFAISFAKSGNPNYIWFVKTCNDAGLSISSVLRLSNKGSATMLNEMFTRGNLKYTVADYETVIKVKGIADEIADALQCNARKNESFYTAVKIVCETKGYDHARMIKNCKSCRSSYAQMASLKDQLKEFERIYNYKVHTGNRLYFSDYLRNKGSNVRDYSNQKTPTSREEDASTLKTV
jgi:hypothetical protein